MNRTAAERRHHRERVISNRKFMRDTVYGSWQPEHVGSLDKDHSMPKFCSKVARPNGNYVVPGVTRAEWWDELPRGKTRAVLKHELRREVEAMP